MGTKNLLSSSTARMQLNAGLGVSAACGVSELEQALSLASNDLDGAGFTGMLGRYVFANQSRNRIFHLLHAALLAHEPYNCATPVPRKSVGESTTSKQVLSNLQKTPSSVIKAAKNLASALRDFQSIYGTSLAKIVSACFGEK
jgi:hypothetical protein